MSRVATPQQPAGTAKPMSAPSSTPTQQIPHEKIAMRAYDKWCKRGCPPGTDQQDWLEAEAEIRAEMSRLPGSMGQRR